VERAESTGWDDDPAVRGWPGLPPLSGDRSAGACVVGLGGSGLAAVAALLDRGLSVVGLDAGRVAAGAAGRNGGFLLGGAAPFLHDAIGRWGAPAAVALYRATLAELDRLEALLGPAVIRRVGSVRLAGLPGEPDDAELADCAAHAAALREHGIAVEDYDGPLGRGIYLPDDASTNPALRALRLAAALRERADLYEGSAVRAVAPGRVHTATGTVRADIVIVAVDGGLERLLPELTGRVRSARLQMLATEPLSGPLPEPRLPCPVYARWGYDYAQQAPDGTMYVGGGRDLFAAAEWTERTAAHPVVSPEVQGYLDGLAPRFAGGPVQVTRRWAAQVGYTPDGRALCTQLAPGLVAVGGYSGTGNLVGPVAARAAVAQALEGAPVPAYFAG
jgi:glycine/D-amino acid oxidase-like deaminating enzyme